METFWVCLILMLAAAGVVWNIRKSMKGGNCSCSEGCCQSGSCEKKQGNE